MIPDVFTPSQFELLSRDGQGAPAVVEPCDGFERLPINFSVDEIREMIRAVVG